MARALLHVWVVLAIVAFLATACAGGSAPAPTAAKPAAAPTAAPAAGAPALSKEYKLSMATGGTSGTYFPFGGVMSSIWAKYVKGVTVTPQATGASVENMRLLDTKQVDISAVQNDIADYAFNGTEMFKDKPVKNFRGVAAVSPGFLQWAATPSIKSLADLKGKRMSVGPAASGTEVNVRQVLESNGITYKDLSKVVYLSTAEAVTAFKDRQLDAFAFSGGIPAAPLTDVSTLQEVAIVPIDGDYAKNVMSKYKFYVPNKIPGGTYKGVAADVMTLTVKDTLVAREDLDADLVYWLTKILIEKQEEIAQGHGMGKFISKESAVQGLTVPWHPGAERYYKEIGVLK